jgi:hypothetical protein
MTYISEIKKQKLNILLLSAFCEEENMIERLKERKKGFDL